MPLLLYHKEVTPITGITARCFPNTTFTELLHEHEHKKDMMGFYEQPNTTDDL
jgi:hypothetical protein